MSTDDVGSRDQSGDSGASATQSRCARDVTDGGVSVSASGLATPAQCRSGEQRDHDDDVTTTTSGSYTVDRARELCSEIDEMFFTSSSTNV